MVPDTVARRSPAQRQAILILGLVHALHVLYRIPPMPVPDFQTLMRPILVVLDDGQDHVIKAIRTDLAEHFSLSQADIDELIPSGRVTTFQNRVGWAAMI